MIRYLFETEGLMTPIDNIQQHPENDNNGDVDEIVTSMLTNGVYRPIYVSRRTNYIVAGNHTYLALLELGAKFVPVVWLDLTPAGELRVLIADNQIARLARREDEQTASLLQQIADIEEKPLELVIPGTGISERELTRLLEPPTPLDFGDGVRPKAGAEMLEHKITCPDCGHTWIRGQG